MTGPVRYRKPAALARLGVHHAAVEASAGTGKTYVLEHLVVDCCSRGTRPSSRSSSSPSPRRRRPS